ncbi:hypothetical protein B296_00037646 [Ensete ventricosum]|uniref:Retrovirus-related Pol polyprotein from transposon TNT 1-94-like beta-barrel domain-containing protein n=1 Tax=Ensete ventricosum TaxID=4639 RepID=A0A426XWL6_ENSVE|nr:hypothetical protein B296_00037646 [Ensete ventricosum]
MTTPSDSQSNWIVDSGASHHITSDLQNLSLYNYGGNEDIIIGDGNRIPITHIGLGSPVIKSLLSYKGVWLGFRLALRA